MHPSKCAASCPDPGALSRTNQTGTNPRTNRPSAAAMSQSKRRHPWNGSARLYHAGRSTMTGSTLHMVIVAFQVERRPAGDFDAVTGVCAKQLPAPLRNLERVQNILAEHACPIGDQNAMRGARDRVFRYADLGRKEPRHEVAPISPGRDDDAAALHPFQRTEIGLNLSHGPLAVQDHHQIFRRTEHLSRCNPQRLHESGGNGPGQRPVSRENPFPEDRRTGLRQAPRSCASET